MQKIDPKPVAISTKQTSNRPILVATANNQSLAQGRSSVTNFFACKNAAFGTDDGYSTHQNQSTGYSFITPKISAYQYLSNERLRFELLKLSLSSQTEDGYQKHRDEILTIHLELNYRQASAPRFRPHLCSAPLEISTFETLVMRDLQVIDQHWSVLSIRRSGQTLSKAQSFLGHDVFDFDRASQFAVEDLSPKEKANALGLTEELQWECATIESESIAQRWRSIVLGGFDELGFKNLGIGEVEYLLLETIQIRTPYSFPLYATAMLAAWLARRIVGNSPAKIQRMMSLILGEPCRSERSIMRTLKRVDALITSAGFRLEEKYLHTGSKLIH